MTPPSDKPSSSPLSTFGLGVAFGVAAAFLFGTQDGRQVLKKVLDSLPDKYKNPLGLASHPSPSPTTPLIFPEETPHHTTAQTHFGTSLTGESPPPPPPAVRPARPEPFTPKT